MTLIFFSLILNNKPSISSENNIDNTNITIEHAITITINKNEDKKYINYIYALNIFFVIIKLYSIDSFF